ncbi:MAG TPA: hypothetical protein PKY05_20005, partial [Fibrobacteria bacterium]|nr:hypothetical protein [Fibrobacteria bacterium]
MITWNFLVTSLIVVFIPGTGVVYTVATGLRLGRRASVFASVGCTAGIVPHLLVQKTAESGRSRRLKAATS